MKLSTIISNSNNNNIASDDIKKQAKSTEKAKAKKQADYDKRQELLKDTKAIKNSLQQEMIKQLLKRYPKWAKNIPVSKVMNTTVGEGYIYFLWAGKKFVIIYQNQ